MIQSSKELLAQQFRFLHKIKRMKESKLRKLHDSTFIGTKYSVKVPKWMHRVVVERRLFYYYCLRHYHYPQDHPIAVEFRKQARIVLSLDYLQGVNNVEQAKQRVREMDFFTTTNIRAMPIVDVDRHLAGLSLYVEGPEKVRRKVLWEWFNVPATDLIRHLDSQGKEVAPRRTGPLNNKYKLRDLILKNPRIGWRDFLDAFGKQMPTVTLKSFHNCRWLLRKAGYDIPKLPMGPSRPTVVSGPGGILRRAKMLNDTTLLGVEEENGQEEPFGS